MTNRENELRIGRFTSSQIHRLMGAPKPRATYIQEVNMERKLERPLKNDVFSKEMSWGHLVEKQAFALLGTEYSLISQQTIKHPIYDSWAGSPDGTKKDAVIEIKCPYTMKSFCELVDIIETGEAEVLKQERPDYYWQIISNAILTERDKGELIVYCPYFSELNDIRLLAEDEEVQQLHKVYWISNSLNEELPYINNGGAFKNLNIMSFEIPWQDAEMLAARVREYEKELTVRELLHQ